MKLQVVHVTWVDSTALGEWLDLCEVDHALELIHTVGMLVHEDKESYFVASTYDSVRKAVNAAIWIPKGCVQDMRLLGAITVNK